MQTRAITPYLIFDGRCRDAMTFYQRCLGGELAMSTYGESGQAPSPEAKDWLIHARLVNGPMVLMASDAHPGMNTTIGTNVSLSLSCASDADVDAAYAKLVEGGTGTLPPHDAFWNARFAMCTDRFGVKWMFDHEKTGA